MMTSFKDFIPFYGLKNKGRSNMKIQNIFSSLHLIDLEISLRDGPLKTNIGIVNLHPFRGLHWVIYVHESYFASYGITTPNKLSKFIVKWIGHCLYPEYKIQGVTSKRDCFCAAPCLYIVDLTKVFGIDFKSAVLNLYYQSISQL